MYTCDRCKKEFCSSQRLNTHVNRKFKCKEYNQHIIHDVILVDDDDMNVPPPISSILLQNPPNLEEEIVKILNSKLKKSENNECEYCKKVFSRHDNLIRHIEKRCKLRSSDANTTNNNNSILSEIINDNKKILDKVKELEGKSIIQNNTTNNTTNNNTNNNIHITNNIINFSDLNYDIDDSFMYQCLKNGFHGDIDYLRRVYIDSVPSDARPVKCLDPSRDKCVVRKNGEWIASTGKDIYRQSLRRIVDNYLRVNNSMIDESEGRLHDIHNMNSMNRMNSIHTIDIKNIERQNSNEYDEDNEYNDDDDVDIQEYLNHYDTSIADNTIKMDEYVDNLNRITKMMEEKNVERVRKHMNILLK